MQQIDDIILLRRIIAIRQIDVCRFSGCSSAGTTSPWQAQAEKLIRAERKREIVRFIV